MKNASPAVDAYIAKAPEFARPILEKFRKAAHRACPDIEETIKWGVPHFEKKGIVASMAAFKQHCRIGFWKGTLLDDPTGCLDKAGQTAMTLGRVEKAADLPPQKTLVALFRQAVALNEQGVKGTPKKKAAKPARKPPTPPPDLVAALAKNARAKKTFENFSPSHQREYVEWICEAKRDETRKRRVATAIEWMSEGKPRNWKYMKKR